MRRTRVLTLPVPGAEKTVSHAASGITSRGERSASHAGAYTARSCAGFAAALLLGAGAVAGAQQTTTPPVLAPYQAPSIALVEPPNGGTVAQDRPTVVFRFAPGEADDPLDLRSFAVTVDGADRSASFQVTASEAWGPLAGGASGDSQTDGLSPGAHQVAARICSSRGACSSIAVTVTAESRMPNASPASPPGTTHRLLDLLLSALRKLVVP